MKRIIKGVFRTQKFTTMAENSGINPEEINVLPEMTEPPAARFSLAEMHGDDGVMEAGIALTAAGKMMSFLRRSRPARITAEVAATAILGTGLGAWHGFEHMVSGRSEINVTSQPARYKKAFVYQLPEKCWGGYQVQIPGATAEYDYKLDVNAPIIGQHTIDTGYRFSETKTGQVSDIVCSSAAKVQPEWNTAGTDVTMNFGNGDFSTFVFDSNPLLNQYNSGYGASAAPTAIMDIILKAMNNIPGVGSLTKNINSSTTDNIQSTLKGLADLEGFYQATKACGDQAWGDLGGQNGPLAAEIAHDVSVENNIPESHVHVNLPSTVSFYDQYEQIYNQVISAAAANGGNLTLSFQNVNSLTCEKALNHNQVTTLAPELLQPATAGSSGSN